MDRQTLRDWVHRYNAEGLAGLRDRPRSGRKPRLTPEQEAELAAVVEQGPDPDRDGVVRWRRVDLKALIEARFAVRLHERSVGKVLRRLGFTRLSVRPEAPEGRRGGAGGVQKGFAELVREALPERARGKPVEVWFQDEARVGQQGTLTRVWARRGTRPQGAARPPLRLGLPVRRGLPGAGGRRRPRPALRRRRGHRPAPGRDRPARHARGARRGRARRGGLARGRRPRRPREPHPPAAALLRARVEPGRERVGVPAAEQARPSRLAGLRGHRRDLLRRLELAAGGARPARLDHPPRACKAQFALAVGIGRAAARSQVSEALGSGARSRVRRQPR